MKTTSEITIKKTEQNWLNELKQPPEEWFELKNTKGEKDGDVIKCIRDKDGKPVLKNGRIQWYIIGKWYHERLNNVIGENWSWTVKENKNIGTSFCCIGTLTIYDQSRDGCGGGDIQVGYGKPKILEEVISQGFENAFKSAETDAFKRACEKFGLGLFLSVNEESAKYAQTEEQRQDAIEEFKLIANDPNKTKEEKNKAFSTLLTKQEQAIVKQQLASGNVEIKQLNN